MKPKTDYRWILRIVLLTICISVVFTLVSTELLNGAGYAVAIGTLLLFIGVGIVFDIIGMAVTSASEAPFHSMASHRERGAKEALRLIKHADRVASVCNDVVGDISGIVSGTTSAVIVTNLVNDLNASNLVLQLAFSGIVAGLTIGGKALGKAAAISGSTKIVLTVGKLIALVSRGFSKK